LIEIIKFFDLQGQAFVQSNTQIDIKIFFLSRRFIFGGIVLYLDKYIFTLQT